MTQPTLRNALKELKKAKTLAERIAAATILINKTAYKAGQALYGIEPHNQNNTAKKSAVNAAKHTSAAPKASAAEPTTIPETLPPEPPKITVDTFTQGLMRIDAELKRLRHDYQRASTEMDRNAIHFKILRLERKRREYLKQHL